ncbi:Vacuolar protein sorting-associated protein 13D [Dermatophagoides farinae]|uniref:Vacuolar protein sorting-associated protein 13D n=1 Tax=Dermatophagoides farinae TaxID=6954 RepID=A0A922KZD5_DERFA|nr:Vacuolar protein sorting-associated protein 13D [Dermatophagoides farinae]
MEMLQQITLSSSGLNAEEFRCRLNNLIDLGFNPRDSLRALALKNGDIIEAAYMLSSPTTSDVQQKNDDLINQNSDTDNHSQSCTSEISAATTTDVATMTTIASMNLQNDNSGNKLNGEKRKKNPNRSRSSSNLLLSILSVIEVKIANGSIRIIDDCNQLDLPLLELGVTDFRLMQYYTRSVEAHAQTNFYCDYYNSHLSGWEPFIENCQIAFSWKHHEPRCHLKSMLNTAAIASTNRIPVARQKLAIKIEIRKMFNLNVSRTLLDLIEKVHREWRQDIENFMSLPSDRRTFRHRQPFIPFALKNDTGTDLHMLLSNSRKMFSTEKAADLITPCDLKPSLDVQADHIVYFDCVDLLHSSSLSSSSKQNSSHKHHRQNLLPPRSSISSTISPLKIYIKVDGWQETFPLSIEREGTFIRHVISERYTNQSAILVFEIRLQSTAIKLITVRSSLLITNRTTKMVELKFVNTAMSDVRTSYMIAPQGIFPVPLDLLYARIQLRPCDLGIGTCSTYINWNHVRKFGELDCSLQICTPITHTQHGSYSKSQAYVVSVLVERNSIGALIESRNIFRQSNQTLNNAGMMMMIPSPKISPLVTLPSHTITLLPPLQLANRLPYELRFKILNSQNGQELSSSSSSASTGTIKSGDDYSVHYISPLESFSIEFQMEHFPRCRPLQIEPGAIKNFETHIDMYDARNRLLILNAHIVVQNGCPKPSNAMTITIYAPYWIVNRSGLPLVFAQDGGGGGATNLIEEAAGQYEEHERARSISPLLFSFANPDSSQYCIMRLGRMLPNMSPRWCNLFCLEKGTFYRRLRVTEYSPEDSIPQEKIYEFGIDIRQGRDRYNQTKIVTIAPRFQIENLTSFKLEFAQKCFIYPDVIVGGGQSSNFMESSNVHFTPSSMSSPIKTGHRNSFSRRLSSQSGSNSSVGGYHHDFVVEKSQMISALPKSNMPFHWPATDRPKLLCVRIASLIGCLWSGCFDVGSEPSVSFQLNIRDDSGRSNFIRVEILLQNATYFIVFTDANSLPPPIRVENFSQVAIEFCQIDCTQHRTIVRPNSSVPYALDEPTQPAHLTVCAPGGSSSTYDLNSFAPRQYIDI